MRTKTNLIIGLSFIVLLIGAVIYLRNSTWDSDRTYVPTNSESQEQVMPDLSPQEAERIIKETALQVVQLIKDKDFDSLSKWVHPEKGVRFSPYAGVDLKEDVVFTVEQIKGFFNDGRNYVWGSDPGSGEPIELTPDKYYRGFIYSGDFVNAKEVSYNKLIEVSNSVENQFEMYPKSIIVEFYVPGSNPKYDGLDWGSLRLVFEAKDDQWYLVGIIHNEWTI